MNDSTTHYRLAAILLAAGPSTRLGQAKQLVEVNHETLVRRTARLLLEVGADPVIVVTGCSADRVENELGGLPVKIAFNRIWEQGMGGSIACGVRKLSENVDGLLVMVCDQWQLEVEDLSQLFECWITDISRIVVAQWHEGSAFVSGPPVIFPREYIPELKFMIKNQGARPVIDRHMDIVEFVNMENAAQDLDRPEDLEFISGYTRPSPSS
jgi:molybdenum cofactor cytidylyltransferase